MPKVEIRQNKIWVGKKSIPLISGEVHYWRLNPSCWKEILDQVRKLGLKVVSTYVPWNYHEVKRGRFDFTGKTHPARNLKGFLDLTRKEKFWVILRPGPYIYSEWPNEGVPDYAYRYHRLHPIFLKYAKEYLAEVAKVFKPYLASRPRGHIIMVQADNEIDPWPDLHGNQYGLDVKPGLFQEFISELYKHNLQDLNEAWGTEYKDFKEASPFIATMFKNESGVALKGDKDLKRNLDYFKFKYYYSHRCGQWNVEAFRSLNLNVPIYLNLYPFFYAHDWISMQSVSDMVGIDLYPTNEFGEDAFEQRKTMDKIRYLRGISKLAYIAEFGSGVWHNRHYETGVLTPNHYRLSAITALAGGVVGWNWYMLVNRDNWYMSPINEWGRVHQELYDVFKQLVRLFRDLDPPSLTRLSEIAVTYNPIQYAARTFSHNASILHTLYQCDIDYELYDPRSGPCPKKVLFYAGNQWLEASSQRNLRRFVESGGTLIAFRDYPRKDDRFQACSIVGFEDPKSILFEFKKKFTLQLAASRPKIEIVSSIYRFEPSGSKPIYADLGNFGKHAVGYIKRIGKGKIIHLGIEPTRELVLEILKFLNVTLWAYTPTVDINTMLFKRGSRFYLLVTNNGDEDKSANIQLSSFVFRGKRLMLRDLLASEKKGPVTERRHPFSVDIPRKDGRAFEIVVE